MAFEVAHEPAAVATRIIVKLVLGFVAFAILLGGALSVYYRAVTSNQRLSVSLVDFPVPRLQPNPTQDWETFHQAQVQGLRRTGWADQARGLRQVPVERAMALVVARGAQAYDPVEGTAPFPTAGLAPLDGAPRATPQPMAAPYGQAQ